MSDTNIHNESVYYNKYMKYKQKYMNLKQTGGTGTIKIENLSYVPKLNNDPKLNNNSKLNCGSNGCSFKLTITEGNIQKFFVLKGIYDVQPKKKIDQINIDNPEKKEDNTQLKQESTTRKKNTIFGNIKNLFSSQTHNVDKPIDTSSEKVNKIEVVLDEETQNRKDRIDKMFSNELLKGIEIAALCNKYRDVSKYFNIPIFFPMDEIIITQTKEEFIKEIKRFSRDMYLTRMKQYKELIGMTKEMINDNTIMIPIIYDADINIDDFLENVEDNTSIDKIKQNDIYIDKLLANIDDKIKYYADNVFEYINDIRKGIIGKLSELDVNNTNDREYINIVGPWLISEYQGPNLYKFSNENEKDIITSIDEYVIILSQIHYVMNFLHSRGIYHLDLRLANICFNYNYNNKHITFIDFCFSCNKFEMKYINKSNVETQFIKDTSLISSATVPPEIYIMNVLYGESIKFDQSMFSTYYMTQVFSKIYDRKKNGKFMYNREYNRNLIKYVPENMNPYYNEHGLKWADYIGVGLGFLDYFIYIIQGIDMIELKIKYGNKFDVYRNFKIFKKIFSMLMSWCMVDYKKRSDNFYTQVKQYNFDTDFVIGDLFTNKFKKDCNYAELRYFEKIYSQLDPD